MTAVRAACGRDRMKPVARAAILGLVGLGVVGALVMRAHAAQPSVFEPFKAGRHSHYVISVCDEEHGQKCSLFPGVTQGPELS